MAIGYGYRGIAPDQTGLFCTDENKFQKDDDSTSAECNSDDATVDSYGYLTAVLNRAMDLMVAKGKPHASAWSIQEGPMVGKLQSSLYGLAAYALTSEAGYTKWTHFNQIEGRPQDYASIRGFALNTIKSVLCNPSLLDEIARKETDEAKAKTQSQINDVRDFAVKFLKKASGDSITEAELACASQ